MGLFKIFTHCHLQIASLFSSRSRVCEAKGKPEELTRVLSQAPRSLASLPSLLHFQSLLMLPLYILSSVLGYTEREEVFLSQLLEAEVYLGLEYNFCTLHSTLESFWFCALPLNTVIISLPY